MPGRGTAPKSYPDWIRFENKKGGPKFTPSHPNPMESRPTKPPKQPLVDPTFAKGFNEGVKRVNGIIDNLKMANNMFRRKK